ncbi:M23 family metallopeptidase [Lolliginicoccus levis]|uniref:M23 family metallopeptidase n=1 Tax=Lolliginicoccus levis TaxID=2919542 RepID=UPI00241C9241|nr:M23 family metallopeptidase [Lolliginicoccus levis]
MPGKKGPLVVVGVLGVVVAVVVLMSLLLMSAAEEEQQLGACGTGSGAGVAPLPAGSVSKPMQAGTYTLSSPYGPRWGDFHYGLDYSAAIAAPIFAFADGVVRASGPATGFGNWVVIDHNIDGQLISTVYGHMPAGLITVASGQQVRAGQQIAGVGSEGQSTGPHLHFEVWPGGRFGGSAVDPAPYVAAAAEPGSAGSSSDGDGGGSPVDLAAMVAPGDSGPASATAPAADAGASLPPLPASKGSERSMTVDGVRVMRSINANFPQVNSIGGYRPSDPYPDHPSGRAVDAMIPAYNTPTGIALGDRVASYFVANADHYNVTYILWRQRIWQNGSWSGMENRGSDTQNHNDHVHITVEGGGMATGSESYAAGQPGAGTSLAGCAGLGGPLDATSVPAEFAPWIQRAGALCPQIPPSLIAAQISAESGFNPAAVSPVGAQGPAQFMPGTWPSYGRDDDGNGQVSPFDIGDAVMAQGRFMCAIASQIDAGIASGAVAAPNGPTELYLAAYNAGPGAVLRSGGFPTGHVDYVVQTRPYADKIIAAEPGFRGSSRA